MKYIITAFIASAFLISCSSGNGGNEDGSSSDTTASAPVQQETQEEVQEESQMYFVNLKDGDVVSSPVIVEMGVKGMEVEPAINGVNEGFGHHHLIIDGAYVEFGETVPMSETSIHYGGGQTADTVELTPGEHSLTLQFANGVHSSYGKAFSKTITVTVE